MARFEETPADESSDEWLRSDHIFGTQRTEADGAVGLQPVVSLVRRAGDGRAIWKHAVFCENRGRLLNQELARVFFDRVLREAQAHLSDERFTVDDP